MQSVLNIHRNPPAATARPAVSSTATNTRGLELGLLVACLALLVPGACPPVGPLSEQWEELAKR